MLAPSQQHVYYVQKIVRIRISRNQFKARYKLLATHSLFSVGIKKKISLVSDHTNANGQLQIFINNMTKSRQLPACVNLKKPGFLVLVKTLEWRIMGTIKRKMLSDSVITFVNRLVYFVLFVACKILKQPSCGFINWVLLK